VLILGAGLTGLSAAVHLRERAVPCRLLERSGEIGGHARTREARGFRFDLTGHVLHLRDAALRERVLGWLDGDCLDLERRSRVHGHGALTRYPFQSNAFGLPPRIAYDCVMGFLAARAAPPGPPPQSFDDFCRQRFGAGISEHFMIPYNERRWGVRASEIACDWCERFVPVPTVEQVVAGAVGLVGKEVGYNARFLYPRRGIGALAAAMHRELGGTAELGLAPVAVDLARRELHLPSGVVPYEALVSTIPLPSLVQLLVAAPPEILAAAAALRATHLYYLDVAVEAPARTDLHWVYLPDPEQPFYRIGCYSNLSPELAPPGTSSYYVELVDRAPPALDRLGPQVAAALRALGFIRPADAIGFVEARRLDPAYVLLDHRHAAATTQLHDFFAAHGVVSTGRYGGWNYSSMEDALASGRDAARRAAEAIGA